MGGIRTRAQADFIRGAGASFLFVLALVASSTVTARQPDWNPQVPIAPDGRANPYDLEESSYQEAVRQGRLHALNYPVHVTGILLPYNAINRFLRADAGDPLRRILQKTASGLNRMRGYDDVENWLGLHSYPDTEIDSSAQSGSLNTSPSSAYFIPFEAGQRPEHRMGFTVVDGPNGKGFTISCAQCHTSDLFGKKVLGLTNRFPRANEFFARGLQIAPVVSPRLFQWSTEADSGDARMFKASRSSMLFVGAKKPAQLGLDTSLAQVALALAKRQKDPWASRVKQNPPRSEPLARFVADSKPAVWWNVKYKNRWLSDGSVISGNPIYTNILWNELGRGTDLRHLESWLARNTKVIEELTTAVFSAEAPKWTDFFSADSIDTRQAKRGQALFAQRCAKCHGTYEKAWDQPNANSLSWAEQIETTRVIYPEQTKVIDVGTDPQRWQGMNSLLQLNDLDISRRNGIVIQTQKGYVPPPLVGIWARWPYFHNNSAPSLCAVLSPREQRPQTYWARKAVNPNEDFDAECNGYPLGSRPQDAPKSYFYDSRREGLSNRGHDEKILLENGREVLTPSDRQALIQFLQTL